MNILKNIYNFFNYLTLIDIIFLVAIVVLLILIVTLIYFIKVNKDVFTEDDFFNSVKTTYDKIDENANSIPVNTASTLTVNEPKIEKEVNDEEGELLDLEGLTQKLKAEEQDDKIKFTEYEKDQEEKAIISYDELLEKHNKYGINYEKELHMDDLVVKKVNLNDLENKDVQDEVKENVRVISYKREEDFLAALKELDALLN